MTAHEFRKTAAGILAAIALFLFSQYRETLSNERTCRIALQNVQGKKIYLDAEIAKSEFKRRKGLMFRESLPQNEGMLFVFDFDQKLSFWMKNTYIPLSIAFIDAGGYVREIYDMAPLNEKIIYTSTHSVRYALEVNRGWFAKNHIAPGCRIFFHGCLGK